jgi:hypothetical protein
MNCLTDRRLARTEQRAQEIGMISKPAEETFTFIDDPEGAEKCRRENPDAIIFTLQLRTHPAASINRARAQINQEARACITQEARF